jgi:ABC transporter with metal-binding/Fe-S-binding domain ATP-binding protein
VRVAALFSGGKDSTYAAYVAQQRGWDLTHLIAIHPADPASMLYHVPNLHLTPLLAEAMGLPLIEEDAGVGEDAELDALRRAIPRTGADGVLVGAIASDYQHRRVNRVAHELGVRVFAPLWRRNPEGLLRDYLAARMRIRFSAVSAEGLDASWLGRPMDESAVRELLRLRDRVGLHPCGEGGEFETLVLWAPNYRRSVEILEAEPIWEGRSGYLQVTRARLT